MWKYYKLNRIETITNILILVAIGVDLFFLSESLSHPKRVTEKARQEKYLGAIGILTATSGQVLTRASETGAWTPVLQKDLLIGQQDIQTNSGSTAVLALLNGTIAVMEENTMLHVSGSPESIQLMIVKGYVVMDNTEATKRLRLMTSPQAKPYPLPHRGKITLAHHSGITPSCPVTIVTLHETQISELPKSQAVDCRGEAVIDSVFAQIPLIPNITSELHDTQPIVFRWAEQKTSAPSPTPTRLIVEDVAGVVALDQTIPFGTSFQTTLPPNMYRWHVTRSPSDKRKIASTRTTTQTYAHFAVLPVVFPKIIYPSRIWNVFAHPLANIWTWQPIISIPEVRIQIARDEQFSDLILNATTTLSSLEIPSAAANTLERLPHFFWRLIPIIPGITLHKLNLPYAKVVPKPPEIHPPQNHIVHVGKQTIPLVFAWPMAHMHLFRFILRSDDRGAIVSIPTPKNEMIVRESLRPGRYTWEVSHIDGDKEERFLTSTFQVANK